MENPVDDIAGVIHALTQSSPDHQQLVIQTYFVPDAAFTHPFCRVDHGTRSRWWIEKIYRWYKIMSPRIELSVNSVAYDAKNLILYVQIHQLFKIWALPFHRAPVDLVTVLQLVKYTPPAEETSSYAAVAAPPSQKPRPLYFIKSQNDLYQSNECAKFVSLFHLLPTIAVLWQWFATLVCALCTYLFYPVTWLEQQNAANRASKSDAAPRELIEGVVDRARATGHDVAQRIAQRANELAEARARQTNKNSDS